MTHLLIRKKTRKDISGLTLIETVVYIGLFSLIMMSLFRMVIFFYHTNRYTLEQSTQLDAARKGVAAMVQNIRESDYSDTGAFPIVSAGADSFSFYSNVDSDALVEKVRFFLSGNNFQEGIIKSTGNPPVYSGTEAITTIAQFVRNGESNTSIFQYYDNTGTEITDYSRVANIAFVKMNLIVNVNPSTLPNEFALRSSATIRNLKTNL